MDKLRGKTGHGYEHAHYIETTERSPMDWNQSAFNLNYNTSPSSVLIIYSPPA
jgi:hypothetical protein